MTEELKPWQETLDALDANISALASGLNLGSVKGTLRLHQIAIRRAAVRLRAQLEARPPAPVSGAVSEAMLELAMQAANGELHSPEFDAADADGDARLELIVRAALTAALDLAATPQKEERAEDRARTDRLASYWSINNAGRAALAHHEAKSKRP